MTSVEDGDDENSGCYWEGCYDGQNGPFDRAVCYDNYYDEYYDGFMMRETCVNLQPIHKASGINENLRAKKHRGERIRLEIQIRRRILNYLSPIEFNL